MIQRIQTIFLFLASAAGLGQFALPYATAEAGAPATQVPALADGVFNPFDNIGLLGLVALGSLLSLIAIFLYRNRQLQSRLTGLAALSTVLLVILLCVVFYQALGLLPAESAVHYQAGLALPLASLVLQWLAGKYIRKDEALVRSMDRLR